jgi:hypothetical protein
MNQVKAPTREHAAKIIELLQHGLVEGVGKPEPGKMCVEAAVCYALGEPHGDTPTCVGSAVRAFKIRLNDAKWPSNQARADGLREIAIAQLGSNEIDQREFAKRVTLKVIQQITPIALRSAAKAVPAHEVALNAAATACEVAADFASAKLAIGRAREISVQARSYAYAAAADAYAAAAAAAAADAAADAAAYAAADAAAAAAYAVAAAAYAVAAAAYAVAAAADAAAAYTAAAADAADAAAAAAADADADAAADARLRILKMAADIGVSVLKELACKGTQWLDLVRP